FSIAYAMEIDMNLLAQVNQISNLNLIFPDTTLKTKYDQNHALVEIEIEQSDTSAVVDLQNKQVVVENEVVAIPEAPAP
ncbi:LysM peptidoglycan-binding domain-containing protein, partial [Streptococcus pyogenes]